MSRNHRIALTGFYSQTYGLFSHFYDDVAWFDPPRTMFACFPAVNAIPESSSFPSLFETLNRIGIPSIRAGLDELLLAQLSGSVEGNFYEFG